MPVDSGFLSKLLGNRYRRGEGLLSGLGFKMGNWLGEKMGFNKLRQSPDEGGTGIPEAETGLDRPLRGPSRDPSSGYGKLLSRYTPEGHDVSIPRLPRTRAMEPLDELIGAGGDAENMDLLRRKRSILQRLLQRDRDPSGLQYGLME